MQPGTLHLLHPICAFVLVRRDDLLHFFWLDAEARGRRPHAVAFGVEDGRFVEVAGADEAALSRLVMVGRGGRCLLRAEEGTFGLRRLRGIVSTWSIVRLAV